MKGHAMLRGFLVYHGGWACRSPIGVRDELLYVCPGVSPVGKSLQHRPGYWLSSLYQTLLLQMLLASDDLPRNEGKRCRPGWFLFHCSSASDAQKGFGSNGQHGLMVVDMLQILVIGVIIICCVESLSVLSG